MAPSMPSAKPLTIKELNNKSAKVAVFEVAVFDPRIHEYSYNQKTTGAPKTGKSFMSILVRGAAPLE